MVMINDGFGQVGSTTFEEMLSLGGKEVVEVEDEEELDAAGRRHRGVLEAIGGC